MKNVNDIKTICSSIKTSTGTAKIYNLTKLPKLGLPDPTRLPFSIKILLENALRNCDGYQVTFRDIERISGWTPVQKQAQEIAFKPSRVILQDFTGVPCVVDLAAIRSAVKNLGGDYRKINPQVPCDLVIDHSLQVDVSGSKRSLSANLRQEFRRNKERYAFLKWGQKAFKNFRVIPPSTGIIHQVNLEYLAQGVLVKKIGKAMIAYPDSVVGTDSHTTMINGIGIVGWGVGGIEAEAVMLGEPIFMLLPDVVGVKLMGKLSDGVTATDVVLAITQLLRAKKVVGKFVEFFGPALGHLSLADRATIANMAPEYGATMGIFPVDNETIRYYRATGRKEAQVDLVERYMKTQGLFYSVNDPSPMYSDIVEFNLARVRPCLAGPKRPQDRVEVEKLKGEFLSSLTAPVKERGFGLAESEINKAVVVGQTGEVLKHGSVVIAAITSCTNTSNPSVLIAAGLLAKKAVDAGLKVPKFVKTSLAPGSRVVDEYLTRAKLLPYLEKLGFHNVGYGCTTCIGNSGPVSPDVAKAVKEGNLVVASVLSGNRNFEGRVHPVVRANYLASPPLVVAYALAGTVAIDLTTQPLGVGKNNKQIFLRDIWPSDVEISQCVAQNVTSAAFRRCYKNVSKGSKDWQAIRADATPLFKWNPKSTYLQEPPFFVGMEKEPGTIAPITGGRVLVFVGDSVTTDHISPAGSIAVDSPAGKYLLSLGVRPEDFNSYGARRGNDRVMARGTFANIRLRNLLVPGKEGPWAVHFPSGQEMSIFDAAERYKSEEVPLVVLAGKEYGTGSSRDWAAKGPALLGVRVVIAQSFERIHRSNLAGMGILPLQFQEGQSAESLGLKGHEVYDFTGIDVSLTPGQDVVVTATASDGHRVSFETLCRLDTPVEIDYFRQGGILQTVIRKLVK